MRVEDERNGASRDVCLVVAGDNDKHRLVTALRSTLEQAGWLELDAVVVDNSDSGVADYVDEHFLDVPTIRCQNRGLGHTYNRALETANARYVLLLGPEVEVCETSLATLVASLDRRPEIGLAGVRQLNSDGSLSPSIRRFPSARHMLSEALGIDRLPWLRRIAGEYERDTRKYEQTTACDWSSGFLLVRYAALERVGWFDERLQPFAGEADLCLRLKRAGWQVAYMPCLTVRRRKGRRWDNARLEAQAAYARMQFARKHFPRAAADYRWALALRYALRVCAFSFSGRGRQQAARAALTTVLKGQAPLDEQSA